MEISYKDYKGLLKTLCFKVPDDPVLCHMQLEELVAGNRVSCCYAHIQRILDAMSEETRVALERIVFSV